MQLCYCLDQIEVGSKIFLGGRGERGGGSFAITPRPPGVFGCYKRLKKILPLIFYLFDALTNDYSRGWSSMINFVNNRFQDVLKKSCQQGEGLIITYSFQTKDVSRMRLPH